MDFDDKLLKQLFDLNYSFEKTIFDGMSFLKSSEHNLTRVQIATLIHLKYLGSSNMSTLSRQVLRQKGSFTPVANSLISKGYITKTPSKEDKRVSILEITPKGLQVAEELQELHIQYVKEQLNKLDSYEQELYLACLNTLIILHNKILNDPIS